MNATNQHLADPGEPEAVEGARAEWYALLLTLFYRAPGAELQAQLRAAPRRTAAESGIELLVARDALLDSAGHLDGAQIEAEYDALFGGVGKPDVYLFGSHYLAGFLNEKPLVELRDDLRTFGVARGQGMGETEDHIACLLDAMQYLIGETSSAGGGGERGASGVADSLLNHQRVLFERHIASWTDALCEALLKHPKARFYARLADLLGVFVAIERQAFEMVEADCNALTQK